MVYAPGFSYNSPVMERFKDFQEALSYLCTITNYEKEPSFFSGLLRPVFDLRAIHRLLESVGNPHKKGRFLHITGTKGKGSTAYLITALLRSMGFRVGTYTSPHLLDMTERITINGEPVSRESLVEYLNLLYPAMERAASDPEVPNPTFFEIFTAMAFLHFSRNETDFSVMEVGLGGRLDSTNVILPLVSIITNIGLDHTRVLGDRLEDIAREKGGIIKRGVPVVTAEPRATPAHEVIEGICLERCAPLLRVGEEITIQGLRVQKGEPQRGLHFSLSSRKREYPSLHLPLFGRHQVLNTAAAVLALEVLEQQGHLSLSPSRVREVLSRFRLSGRMEVLSEKPAFVVDGAHNPLAIRNLRENLVESFSFHRLILIFAAAKDKDLKGILEDILPVVNVVILTRTNSPRSATEKEYGELKKGNPGIWEGKEIVDEPDFKKAVQKAFNLAEEGDLILATGSFYLVGDILAWMKGSSPD